MTESTELAPRARKPKAELVRAKPASTAPQRHLAKSPSAHINDPNIVPSTNLKVQAEHMLQGFDNDIELLTLEINTRQIRLEDLQRSRESVLAMLSTLARPAVTEG